ncbi:hypothetical protein LB507_009828, partial [Fusarium sp. FIESC RH6]
SMGLASLLGFGVSAPDCHTGDICALLRAILPVFDAIAERTRHSIPDSENTEETQIFYTFFNASIYSLLAVLVKWDPAETVQRLPADESNLRKTLMRVLDELENVFVSQKGEEARRAFERLDFQRRPAETYPKLRALRRVLPHDDTMGESFLKDVECIIRIYKKSSEKRARMLGNLQRALDFLYNTQPFTLESDPSCPIRFSDYPRRHVQKLAKTLFDVLQRSWSCQCCSSTSHVGRKTRLNLTQHQRFETVPAAGQILCSADAHFRLLFPTTSHTIDWQDTEIIVTERDRVTDERIQPKHGLCGIIQGVKAGIRPRMMVCSQTLWQLEADAERSPLSSPQVQDGQFTTLRDLLRPNGSNHESLLSSMKGRDRLILSFILSTSFLHFVNGPWIRTSLSSDNICFLVSNSRSSVDITRPYLSTSFTTLSQPPLPRDLNQPHRFPDLLSLGVLLLEIARGAPLEFKEPQDHCVVALQYMDKWFKNRRSGHSRLIPEGLYRAVSACIDPKESRTSVLDKSELAMRNYVFERVIYPLENALSTAYEIQLNALHPDTDQEEENSRVGSFDHQDEYRQEKLEAAEEWLKHLNTVHDLFDKCQDRCATEAVRRATRVKVAVLDTGLQLPIALQENYEAEGRINVQQSTTFIQPTKGETNHKWNVDVDGHGSRVGEIILRFGPAVDLHVAKVFRTREDLANPSIATQVHKRIAEAIRHTTDEWKADMIIMSFGFESPIPAIRKAIDMATRRDKPPLFFAATRNDGAHKSMAWPARDMSVIGVSSTAGDGSISTFNPSDSQTHSVLYAFGEGVPVNVTAPDDPKGFTTKYVSGTSYAAPVAAALTASLLGCLRAMAKTGSPEDQRDYSHVPEALQRMGDMLTILKRHMQKESVCGVKSLLPWDFLNFQGMVSNKILEDVATTLLKG